MNGQPLEALVEATLSAHRERDPSGRILPSGAWLDLAPDDREAAFDALVEARRLEAAWDADGLSATARAVLARVIRLDQLR